MGLMGLMEATRAEATPEQFVVAGRTAPRHVELTAVTVAGESSFRPGVKRSVDVAVAVLALALLLPLLLLIALAIKLDSRGPVLYRVRRVGYRGRPLLMLKFRKMHHHARGLPLTAEEDPRLTRIGKLLTRTRLDELPQLWDVLRGRMSIVGPRPEDPAFAHLHEEAYRAILSVRPGITGLSQLAFAAEREILGEHDPIGKYVGRILPQKVVLDTLYSQSYGLRRDLAVICWTVVAVLLRKQVAVHRATGQLSIRRRPRLAYSSQEAASAMAEAA